MTSMVWSCGPRVDDRIVTILSGDSIETVGSRTRPCMSHGGVADSLEYYPAPSPLPPFPEGACQKNIVSPGADHKPQSPSSGKMPEFPRQLGCRYNSVMRLCSYTPNSPRSQGFIARSRASALPEQEARGGGNGAAVDKPPGGRAGLHSHALPSALAARGARGEQETQRPRHRPRELFDCLQTRGERGNHAGRLVVGEGDRVLPGRRGHRAGGSRKRECGRGDPSAEFPDTGQRRSAGGDDGLHAAHGATDLRGGDCFRQCVRDDSPLLPQPGQPPDRDVRPQTWSPDK